MKIAFLLGSPDINGGTYVIYEHASRLVDVGHEVTVITRQPVTRDRYAWHSRAQDLEWLTFDLAKKKLFDIVIATWWQSPFLLHELSASHYVYFVQSIETRFFAEEDPEHHDNRDLSIWKQLCESTYSYNLPIITEARWIQDYLYEQYNNTPFLVRNGIRKDIYQPEGESAAPRVEGQLRVLVEGPVDVFYKNVPKSVELCRQAGVDEIWLLTSSDIHSFPGVDRVFSRLAVHETPSIYRSCDVLVKLSYIEGMFGPPLEMFHCGGTAIVYDVTGRDEYIFHNENSYVIDRDEDEQVVRCLRRLKEKPEILQQLKKGAADTAYSWPDWQVSSSEFEQALVKIRTQKKTSRAYLKRWTEKLSDDNTSRLRAREVELFLEREKHRGSDNERIDNFIQLYWHGGEGWSQERFKWVHYKSGERTTVSFEVDISCCPFWIRLDPGVRLGMIEIYSIEVLNRSSGRTVMKFFKPDDFDVLYMDGTICRVTSKENGVYFSYGSDPQLILPAIEEGEIGDSLRIEISLQEMGVRRFVDEYCSVMSPGNFPIISVLWNRIVGRLFQS